MKVINLTKNTVLADKVIVADTFFKRGLGLIGKKVFSEKEGLFLKPCKAIHSFFVAFPFDVIFLDDSFIVVKMIERFKPWRLSSIVWKANFALELYSGTIAKTGTQLQDQIGFSK